MTPDTLPPAWIIGRDAQERLITQIEPQELGPGAYYINPDGSRRTAWCRPRGKAFVKKLKRVRRRGLKVSTLNG
jgi:hypothetical protein